MTKYKDFRPTAFDSRGLNADQFNIGEMLVVPCMRTRDSNVLDESNFHSALKTLGGEDGEHVQVHRFGHWGPGWFEIIIVDESKREIAQEIEDSLANYPILDESDWSEREYNQASEYWNQCSIRERVEWLQRAELSVFAARHELSEINDDSGRLYELLTRE